MDIIITTETTTDDMVRAMDSLLAERFDSADEITELTGTIAQLNSQIKKACSDLVDLDGVRPAGADVEALTAWAAKRASADLLIQTLKHKVEDDERALYEFHESRQKVKKKIFEEIDGYLYSHEMTQSHAKNAEIARLEKEIAETKRKHIGYGHAVRLGITTKQAARTWIAS